jgi:RNA-directed DNA polymerase
MLIPMIEKELQLDAGYLTMLAATASHRYKEFFIDKASGGKRRILHPAKELKTVQRWIHERIISHFPVHESAGAYRRGQGLLDHVTRHRGNRFFLRMDFEDFFPSLSADDIRHHFRKHAEVLPPQWSDQDTDLLNRFVCVKGQLTIGAVTSPSLSNTLCYELDCLLFNHCFRNRIVYTRYADDLFFSTSTPNLLSQVETLMFGLLKSLEYPRDLRINQDKTRHSSQKGHVGITGLTLTPDGKVSIGRKRKRRLKALIHQWDSLGTDGRRSLAGHLAYCKAVEPDFLDALYRKYGNQRLHEIRTFPAFLDTEKSSVNENGD